MAKLDISEFSKVCFIFRSFSTTGGSPWQVSTLSSWFFSPENVIKAESLPTCHEFASQTAQHNSTSNRSTWSSQSVKHPSNVLVHCFLTSGYKWELVFLTWPGHWLVRQMQLGLAAIQGLKVVYYIKTMEHKFASNFKASKKTNMFFSSPYFSSSRSTRKNR